MSTDPSGIQELVFNGTDGTEAEEFIRSVMKVARAAGKLRDNSWIADEAAVAFTGEALRWYVELDEETRNDWMRLQRAIMQKYPSTLPPYRPNDDLAFAIQQSTVPTLATSALHPAFFFSTATSGRPSYIRMVLQDTSESLYVGIKNGNVVAVASPNEGVTVRHDRVTKELRIFQSSTNGETGEKLEIRLPPWSYMDSSTSTVIRMATFQLLSARGYPKGQDPIRNGESFTSWNVMDDGVLEAVPRNGSAYPIHPYLRSRDADTNYPRIRAHMDDPSDPVTSSMRFLTLRLEEF